MNLLAKLGLKFLAKGLEKVVRDRPLRFVALSDPPFPYGFGLDTPAPVREYWVVPPYMGKGWRVYARSAEPTVDHPAEDGPREWKLELA
jgi:hypothetical protein